PGKSDRGEVCSSHNDAATRAETAPRRAYTPARAQSFRLAGFPFASNYRTARLIHARLLLRLRSRRFFRRNVRGAGRGAASLQQIIRALQGNGAKRIRAQT